MKWLNKIIGKQNQQKPHTIATIAFYELEDWVANESKVELDEFFGSAAQIFAEIKRTKEQLVRDINTLETAAEPPEVPARASRVGLAARDNIIKQINTLIDRIGIPTMDYSDIMNFCRSADDYLETTLEKSLKSHHQAKYLFPKEVGTVISDISRIKKSLTKLKGLLDGKDTEIRNFDEISGDIQLIKDIKGDLIRYDSEINDVSSKMSDIQHKINDCTARLEQLSLSKEWSSFVELESELKQTEKERDNIETSVMELFMPLGKALNRMKKQSTSGRHTLSKKQMELLDDCLKNPISADAADINDFLTEMCRLVESGTLGLKDKKRDKIIDQIKHIIESFASKKDGYENLSSHISDIEHQISDLTISETKTTLEKQLAENTRKFAQLEDRLGNLKEELKIWSEELENQKKNLSDEINSIKPVRIVFD
ncbi:MAG: hypothetical protein U9N07_06260 [Euryarchaeota archaeon]|nr:hypothetical protein [Euryarchaeota archaeon]